ncbi:MAG: single-stranded DNA-binding protein [Candidatus Sumerlaeaceae bacterium]
MLSINKVMITGRLTRDPETKYLPSGMAVTTLGVAVNRRFQDKSGEWRDDTTFIDVEAWAKLAERCAETMKKGQPVFVEGRLKQDTWERDGQKQSKIKISADNVKSFDAGSRAQGGESGGEGEESEGGGYSGGGSAKQGSGGGNRGGTQQARRGPAATGAPSDNLDFDSGPAVHDDIPF